MDKLPVPTERLIKRLRRQARKLQALAPQQSAATVTLPAVVVRAIVNTNWQAAGRLEDIDKPVRDHNGECLTCDEPVGIHAPECRYF